MPRREEVKAEITECVQDIFGAYSQSRADAAAERILPSFKGRGWEVLTWNETERLEDFSGRQWPDSRGSG